MDRGEVSRLVMQLEDDAQASVDALLQAFAPDARTTDARRLVESFQESVTEVRLPSEAALEALKDSLDSGVAELTLIGHAERDPILAHAILCHANTPFYTDVHGPSATLPIAVHRIGAPGVHSAILERSVGAIAQSIGGVYPSLVDRIWSHMRRTAQIARVISPAFEVSAERAYATGLLHDVGKLVVLDHMGSLRKLIRRDPLIPTSIMSGLLRVLHEDLGGLTALHWGLDPELARGVATHHRTPAPHSRQGLSELAFVAERCDLMALSGSVVDLESLWSVGKLSGSKSRLASILDTASWGPRVPELPSAAVQNMVGGYRVAGAAA